MKPLPHHTDPASIDPMRCYSITDAAQLIGWSRSRMKYYAQTGELRTEIGPKRGMYLIKGSNLRLFYIEKVGCFWPAYAKQSSATRRDARQRTA